MRKIIIKDNKKRLIVAKYEKKKLLLKSIQNNTNLSFKVRWIIGLELSSLPKNSSMTRLHRRCLLTSRSRSNFRKFSISRIMLRDLAGFGLIPGIKKSSW
jgi:small subunit ribosomal protein S14